MRLLLAPRADTVPAKRPVGKQGSFLASLTSRRWLLGLPIGTYDFACDSEEQEHKMRHSDEVRVTLQKV